MDVGESDATVTDRVEDTVDYAEVCHGRRPGRPAALLPHAGAAVRGDRRPAARAVRPRERVGEGGQARAADPAPRGGGLGRGVAGTGGVTKSRGSGRIASTGHTMSQGGRSDPATFSGFLGLGSNLGDRRGHLQDAVDALPGHGVDVLASSSVYETEPVGEVLDQPDVPQRRRRGAHRARPRGVLEASKAIERDLGRKAGGRRHAPRPIDIDLLLFGDAPLRLRASAPAPRRGHQPPLRARPPAGARPRPAHARRSLPARRAGRAPRVRVGAAPLGAAADLVT